MSFRQFPLIALTALALTACGEEPAPAPEATAPAVETETATAVLMDTEGNEIGSATARNVDGVLTVSVTASGLEPGPHGAHIHETGDCSAADFTSAGGHWNPEGVNHGIDSEQPNPHAGDLPNITADENGDGTLEAESTGTFAGLFDDDGSAFIIHADPDDYRSQPTGEAGSRVACGVFERG